jgi:hypothetical protein
MNVTILDEPDLEFANGSRHIDPRSGITNYGPADASETSVRTIKVGIIGIKEAIEGVKGWLDRCREPIAAKQSHLSHLYIPFPGFDTSVGYRSTIVWNSRLERILDRRAVASLASMSPLTAVQAAVELYDQELTALNEEPNCDVVIVCRPDVLPEREEAAADPERPWLEPKPQPLGFDFHELLKARSLRSSRPIQIIRRETWDPSFKPKDREERRQQQDEATKAWNLHTALYYKAGGVPWRLTRNPKDLTNCYVGVAFYRSADQETLQTSVAQVFNERGDGVIVRGAQATQSKEDRQPHLTGEDAKDLLEQSLARYRSEHRTMPARVMLHKTSSFTPDELEGFRAAADAERLDTLEMVWIPRADPTRLFRQGEQPPLRGTLLSVTDSRHILYTRGSVPFYRTYPGLYVPTALPFRLADVDSSPTEIASELLALSKMNWNATQLDGRVPITLRTADSIGRILKHLGQADRPAPRYAFYM